MPGRSGYDLAEVACRLQPDLKVLFSTGYASELPGDAVGQQRMPMPRRPFRQAEVAGAVPDASPTMPRDGATRSRSVTPAVLRVGRCDNIAVKHVILTM
jgi:hypothetical protein